MTLSFLCQASPSCARPISRWRRALNQPRGSAIRRQKRDSGDQGSRGVGLYVDEAHRHRYATRRRAIHDACRPYVIHSHETGRKMGAGTRCQHVGPRVGQMTRMPRSFTWALAVALMPLPRLFFSPRKAITTIYRAYYKLFLVSSDLLT